MLDDSGSDFDIVFSEEGFRFFIGPIGTMHECSTGELLHVPVVKPGGSHAVLGHIVP